MMGDEQTKPDGIVLTEEQKSAAAQRSIAIALALGVLVVLFFAVTMVKGPAVLDPADVRIWRTIRAMTRLQAEQTSKVRSLTVT